MQMAPKVVTATDEDELAARIRKAEEENAEVDGDEDADEQVGGNFVMQMAPKVVTATDEDELAARIRKAEEENAEVDGDEDDDEQVGMGGNKDVGSGSEDDED